MTTNLWRQNHPRKFWQCTQTFSDDLWSEAIKCAVPILGLKHTDSDTDIILEQVLGEGQFGPDHWTLSRIKRLYYLLKPLLPRTFTRWLRQLLNKRLAQDIGLSWPIEDRYPRFQFEVLKNLLALSGQSCIQFRPLWPFAKEYAFVLTHDIESAKGQAFVRRVVELEEKLGFRSSFNFVPARYRVDFELVNELQHRGFEIGIHGLKHDGKLFNSRKKFMHRASLINRHLKEFGAIGFRAPLTHRNPEWMQALDIEYDLSFFDTDPFEPIPGGTMSIWPFFLGHFVELPYTLVQDYTLTSILGEATPRLWLEKVDFIEKYHGMALINSHPDYLQDGANLKIYSDFLAAMKHRNGFWHALPRDAARWWRNRSAEIPFDNQMDGMFATAALAEGGVRIESWHENGRRL